MWFKYYKGYYDVRKLELELVSWRETFWVEATTVQEFSFDREISLERIL